MSTLSPAQIAQVCHEANRALQLIQNDPAIPVAEPWDDLPTEQQDVVVGGVEHALIGASPRDLHRSWLIAKARDGWRYGPVKDAEARTHPCMVSYELLPNAQRVKDALFAAVVRALARNEIPPAVALTDRLAVEHADWPAQQVVDESARISAELGTALQPGPYAQGGVLPAFGGQERTLDPAKPAVCRMVHYVSHGTPGGEYGRECRAAVVTQVHPLAWEQKNGTLNDVGLAVHNPSGLFFDLAVKHDGGRPHEGDLGETNLCTGLTHDGGTWHWPVAG